jgi:hypothetical protein
MDPIPMVHLRDQTWAAANNPLSAVIARHDEASGNFLRKECRIWCERIRK